MSEEKITAEETTVEETKSKETEETGAKPAKKKKPFFNADNIEIIVAILLGVTALLTAWATWIGSLHGGNQATNYAKSNNLASEGNSEYNAGIQDYFSDMMTWNTVMDYTFDKEIALINENEAEAQLIDQKIDTYVQQNGSEILIDASNNMTEDTPTPFDVPGMTDKYFEKANSLLSESQELLEQGMKDNANGDAYNLVNVIYSVVLFMLGIVGIFKRLPNRTAVLCIAAVALVFATIYMCTIPLPTGFNIMNFFGPK